jgi:hypothetical protein
MRCVGYLPDRTRQSWNKNARMKLYIHEAKLCIRSAWFLMHLSFCGTKERYVGVGVIDTAPWLFILFSAKG